MHWFGVNSTEIIRLLRLGNVVKAEANVEICGVSISLRDRSAEGTGRISETAGAGSWHGNGANSTTCAGTWEAERR
jgi:hypothetical protein